MDEQLLSKCSDTENYLIDFLDLSSIFVYAQLSLTNYNFIKNNKLYINLLSIKQICNHKNIQYKELFYFASQEGYVNVLNWLITKCKEYEFIYAVLLAKDNLIDPAINNGHVDVIDWWQNKKPLLKKYLNIHIDVTCDDLFEKKTELNKKILDIASANGHVNILNWWLKNYTQKIVNPDGTSYTRIKLMYTTDAMDTASMNGHIDVLNWWKQFVHCDNYKCKYTEKALDSASTYGHLNVLKWWKTSGLELKYTEKAIDYASANCNFNILTWWIISKLKLKYTNRAVDDASGNGDVTVLSWWKFSGLEIKYTSNAIDKASANGHIEVLEWWKKSGLIAKQSLATEFSSKTVAFRDQHVELIPQLKLKYTDKAIDKACLNGHVDILEWWKNSGLELKYSCYSFYNASHNGHVNVLEWWKNSGLRIPIYNYGWVTMNNIKRKDVVTWWRRSGLMYSSRIRNFIAYGHLTIFLTLCAISVKQLIIN